jgi:hypothetical protein
MDENGAALPFQGISITDERLLEGKTLGPKVHRFGSETPWNDQFFECIRELECPAKMSGEHVRRQFPCSAGLSVTLVFLLFVLYPLFVTRLLNPTSANSSVRI